MDIHFIEYSRYVYRYAVYYTEHINYGLVREHSTQRLCSLLHKSTEHLHNYVFE